MKLTGNPRGVQLLIVALLVATLWFSCRAAKADEVFFASAGASLRGSDAYSGGLRVGMESGPWQASIVTMGAGDVDKPDGRHIIEPNIAACGTWHRSFKRMSIGWGACLWEHGDFSVGDQYPVAWDDGFLHPDDGLQLTAAIVLRRTFGESEQVYVELFHASSGGSTHYNAGRNLVGAGFRF
jgi:hypothetical protein